jgi:hypothetical protein
LRPQRLGCLLLLLQSSFELTQGPFMALHPLADCDDLVRPLLRQLLAGLGVHLR